MRLANGDHGYGIVTKLLHWLSVLAVAGQLAIGLTMDADAAADRADDRADAFEERGEERAEGQGEDSEERFEAEVERREEAVDASEVGPRLLAGVVTGAAFADGVDGIDAHLAVGLLVLVLALLRLLWRRTTPLPPWAPHLSSGERTLEAWLEKALLTLMVVVPGTGLALVLGDDDLVPVHVAAQLALLATVAVHVGLVLKHTVVRRERHLSRML